MLFRVAASMSVAVQRGNFDVLSTAVPALAESAGLLGRPLSEEPDFWRPAPAAAVAVAGDTL